MNKIKTWMGDTQSHGFIVDVFHDPAAGQYIAEITPHSPVQRHVTSKPQPSKFEKPEKLMDKDIDKLLERTKNYISSHFGEIKIFTDK